MCIHLFWLFFETCCVSYSITRVEEEKQGGMMVKEEQEMKRRYLAVDPKAGTFSPCSHTYQPFSYCVYGISPVSYLPKGIQSRSKDKIICKKKWNWQSITIIGKERQEFFQRERKSTGKKHASRFRCRLEPFCSHHHQMLLVSMPPIL